MPKEARTLSCHTLLITLLHKTLKAFVETLGDILVGLSCVCVCDTCPGHMRSSLHTLIIKPFYATLFHSSIRSQDALAALFYYSFVWHFGTTLFRGHSGLSA